MQVSSSLPAHAPLLPGAAAGGANAVHVIDCDADPFVPYGWQVEEHQKGGMLIWDVARQKDALYLAAPQREGHWVASGNALREELRGKPVLNANVLDDLLQNPDLIPAEWEKKFVFFWGTIYRDHGGLYVRYLCRRGGAWFGDFGRLVGAWSDESPAALRAS